jgi:aromatic-L-amino-acid/L-tryptophan decarboxylase
MLEHSTENYAEKRIKFAIEATCQRVASWVDRRARLPVTPQLSREALEERLLSHDFSAPRDLAELVHDVADLLEQGGLHSTHPRYFGLFNPSVRGAGIIADALVAAYNPQLGAWWHAPAASEIESKTLNFFCERLGLHLPGVTATFTTGGSEANLTGVLSALTCAFPRYVEAGIDALDGSPVFYASDQAHDSLTKIAGITGLGRNALRRVRSDNHQRLDVDELRRMLTQDRCAGKAPFLVVATTGTPATGAIDPLDELAILCRDEGLWLHVDAAWGGIAALSDSLRHHISGIASGDSITWDAHKGLPVPMGAGMFFCRRRGSDAVFSVDTGYVPDAEAGRPDLYQTSMQWSRRFIGLKVFLTLAELGSQGVAALVEHQTEMGQLLRSELRDSGWQVMNDSPLPLVCFSRGDLSGESVRSVAQTVVSEGNAWISEVRLAGTVRWLRACITNHHTQPSDIRELVAAINRAFEAV